MYYQSQILFVHFRCKKVASCHSITLAESQLISEVLSGNSRSRSGCARRGDQPKFWGICVSYCFIGLPSIAATSFATICSRCALNAGVTILFGATPSTWNASMKPSFCRRCNLQTPSPCTVDLMKSSIAAAKLMQVLPSHVPCPCRFTMEGIFCVSCSINFSKWPSGDRKPTMIFGTPRRKDCAQNFKSFRSYFTSSFCVTGCWAVLSSTHGIGSFGLSGFAPMTASTSPPRIMLVPPMPVVTMEQYWASLSTGLASRFSISSRVASAQGLLSRASDSNL